MTVDPLLTTQFPAPRRPKASCFHNASGSKRQYHSAPWSRTTWRISSNGLGPLRLQNVRGVRRSLQMRTADNINITQQNSPNLLCFRCWRPPFISSHTTSTQLHADTSWQPFFETRREYNLQNNEFRRIRQVGSTWRAPSSDQSRLALPLRPRAANVTISPAFRKLLFVCFQWSQNLCFGILWKKGVTLSAIYFFKNK